MVSDLIQPTVVVHMDGPEPQCCDDTLVGIRSRRDRSSWRAHYAIRPEELRRLTIGLSREPWVLRQPCRMTVAANRVTAKPIVGETSKPEPLWPGPSSGVEQILEGADMGVAEVEDRVPAPTRRAEHQNAPGRGGAHVKPRQRCLVKDQVAADVSGEETWRTREGGIEQVHETADAHAPPQHTVGGDQDVESRMTTSPSITAAPMLSSPDLLPSNRVPSMKKLPATRNLSA